MLTANSATIYHLIFAPRFYLVPNFIGKAYKTVRRSDQMIEISNDKYVIVLFGYNIIATEISVGLLPWDFGKLILSSYKIRTQNLPHRI